jgi:hypothetical protein
VTLNQVTSGYFDTFRMRIVKGRPFLPQDRAGSAKVAILNQSAARYHFGDSDPIGRHLRFPRPGEAGDYEIIGIVADVRYESLRVPPNRMAYVPLEQALDRIVDVASAVPGTVRRSELGACRFGFSSTVDVPRHAELRTNGPLPVTPEVASSSLVDPAISMV